MRVVQRRSQTARQIGVSECSCRQLGAIFFFRLRGWRARANACREVNGGGERRDAQQRLTAAIDSGRSHTLARDRIGGGGEGAREVSTTARRVECSSDRVGRRKETTGVERSASREPQRSATVVESARVEWSQLCGRQRERRCGCCDGATQQQSAFCLIGSTDRRTVR